MCPLFFGVEDEKLIKETCKSLRKKDIIKGDGHARKMEKRQSKKNKLKCSTPIESVLI